MSADDLDRGALIDAWLAAFDGNDLALHKDIAAVFGAHADVDVAGRRLLLHLERCGALPAGWPILIDMLVELVWRGFVDVRVADWFARARAANEGYWVDNVPHDVDDRVVH